MVDSCGQSHECVDSVNFRKITLDKYETQYLQMMRNMT
jgi:hypothetical protein